MKAAKKNSEILFLTLLLLYGCLSLFNAFKIEGAHQSGEILTPGMYVILLCAAFILGCFWAIFQSIWKNGRNGGDKKQVDINQEANFRVAIMMALGFAFAIGVKTIGFYLSAFVLVFVGFVTIEGKNKRNLLTAGVFAIGMCIAFYFMFQSFNIYLPSYKLDFLFSL